jgi:hypothetical protein
MKEVQEGCCELFAAEIELTPSDTRTHKTFEFPLPSGIDRLIIETAYAPKVFPDRNTAQIRMLEGVLRCGLDRRQIYGKPIEELSDLVNLIILSADLNGRYLGAAHRHAPEQRIHISPEGSSPGFFPAAIEPGSFRITVSVFLVLTEQCVYRIRVTGEPVSRGGNE